LAGVEKLPKRPGDEIYLSELNAEITGNLITNCENLSKFRVHPILNSIRELRKILSSRFKLTFQYGNTAIIFE